MLWPYLVLPLDWISCWKWDICACTNTKPSMKFTGTFPSDLCLWNKRWRVREILFLFEAYTALLRAGTEVDQDEEWKEQARKNKGILLSIDGIQPDAGNETI